MTYEYDLYEILRELNEKFAGEVDRDNGIMEAAIMAECKKYGIPVREIVKTQGQWGSVYNIRLEPEPGQITIKFVKR